MVFCYVKNTCTRLAMARVYYSVYYVRLVMGRVYYSWLWKDMKALVINTHETDLKFKQGYVDLICMINSTMWAMRLTVSVMLYY